MQGGRHHEKKRLESKMSTGLGNPGQCKGAPNGTATRMETTKARSESLQKQVRESSEEFSDFYDWSVEVTSADYKETEEK